MIYNEWQKQNKTNIVPVKKQENKDYKKVKMWKQFIHSPFLPDWVGLEWGLGIYISSQFPAVLVVIWRSHLGNYGFWPYLLWNRITQNFCCLVLKIEPRIFALICFSSPFFSFFFREKVSLGCWIAQVGLKLVTPTSVFQISSIAGLYHAQLPKDIF